MWLTLRLDIRHAVSRTTACERGSADLTMAQLTEAQIQQVIDQCRDHVGQLAEAFRTALACEIRLSAGEPSSVGEAAGLAEFQVPGLAVGIAVGDEGLIVLIPQTLPLPAWYRQPDVSQNDQLQTLAHELSTLLLPAELESERFAAIATENLIEVAREREGHAFGQDGRAFGFSHRRHARGGSRQAAVDRAGRRAAGDTDAAGRRLGSRRPRIRRAVGSVLRTIRRGTGGGWRGSCRLR